jgi:hypothetical protein
VTPVDYNTGAEVKYTASGAVKVDNNGIITAVKAGQGTVYASVRTLQGIKRASVKIDVLQPVKVIRAGKTSVKVNAPKSGRKDREVTFKVSVNPSAKKFVKSGSSIEWKVKTTGSKIALNEKKTTKYGKGVFNVPAGAQDSIVYAEITDAATGRKYVIEYEIDVK